MYIYISIYIYIYIYIYNVYSETYYKEMRKKEKYITKGNDDKEIRKSKE